MTPAEFKKYVATITSMAPYENAEKFKELFEEMAVHTRKRKPKELLLKRRPNEPDDVYDYRIKNYEPITYGSMNKAFDNLYRIINGINHTLHIANDDVVKYLQTKKFMRNTFDMFFSKIFLKRMIEDANGFLLWLPGGAGLEDSSKPIKPYPVLMFSYNIIDWGDDHIVFLSDEKTFIEQGTGKQKVLAKIGKVYYILTSSTFYKYKEQTGGKYILEEIYVHNLGEIPMVPLGGDFNADGFFESFFAPYVAFGNEAIRQFSDWQALSTTAAHPIREVFEMECEVQEVKKKKTRKGEEDDNLTYSRTVEVKPFAVGPHGEIRRPIGETDPDGLMGKYLPAAIPTIRYISPPIEYVKNAQESTNNLLEKAEDSLHLNLGNIALSGKAKEIDLLSHEDMLNKIGNQIFDAKQSSARFVVAYMTMATYEATPVKLTKPNSLRVKSEAEILQELQALKTAAAPAFLVCAISRQLGELRFSGDEVNKKILTVICTYDFLFMYSVQEKQSMVISGTVQKDLVTKSTFIYPMLLKILQDIGEAQFVDMPPLKLYEKFNVEVNPYLVPEETILKDALGNQIK